MNNDLIRVNVRTLYDMQTLRIQTGNRIVAAFRYKFGLESSDLEESNAKATKALDALRAEYKRLTDGVKHVSPDMYSQNKLITDEGELKLIAAYDQALKAEMMHEKALIFELKKYPIWTEYLRNVHGVGPRMAGVIISEFDIHKADTVSAMWKYCGLDVIQVERNGKTIGEGRCRREEHLVPKEYVSRKTGKLTQTRGITFNPFLKTKMVGVLADVFIKSGGKYRDVYDGYKCRLQYHPVHSQKTKGHINNMAKRYMIKIFLQDLYVAWRTIEGLPVRAPYAEEKLGIVHSKVA